MSRKNKYINYNKIQKKETVEPSTADTFLSQQILPPDGAVKEQESAVSSLKSRILIDRLNVRTGPGKNHPVVKEGYFLNTGDVVEYEEVYNAPNGDRWLRLKDDTYICAFDAERDVKFAKDISK